LKKVLLVMSSVAMLTACATKVEDPTPAPKVEHVIEKKDSNLVWEDNFDNLNKKRWNLLDEGWKDHGRLHRYVPKNVTVNKGILSLETKKENYKGFTYTSSAITTQGKAPIKYGKIEVRAKFPKGKGLLPAIWMLPENGEPYPEIDFAELLAEKPNELWNVIHYQERGKHKRDFTGVTSKANLTDDFHVYGVEWRKDKVTFTLDGKVTFVSKKSPNVPMYLYINTAVGGTWAGAPAKNQKFPVDFKIDYVRVYK